MNFSVKLNSDSALIFRITHARNIPWILENGLHCPSSSLKDEHFHEIGNPDLISRRADRPVPIAPFGTLKDYVPFYFTPYSVMLYNISTGYGGTPHVSNENLVILVSRLSLLAERHIPFVFTDQHAYLATANFFSDMADLSKLDWGILQRRDFRHDPEDPGKKQRYQAEALVYKSVPQNCLIGMGCHSEGIATLLKKEIEKAELPLEVYATPHWYF